MISARLVGQKISSGEISKPSKELTLALEQWRERDLSEDSIKYVFVDGVTFPRNINRRNERVPVLASIGITQAGHKLLLPLEADDKESASSWRELLKNLRSGGLDSKKVTLGIMGGLPGLDTVFEGEFARARIQRCQTHVAQNVLAKLPKKLKQALADDMRSIFYASSKQSAMEFFDDFKQKWKNDLPPAVSCLEKSIGVCLAFFNLPQDERISLRTTSIIQHLNKDFKRRTKPMEIVVLPSGTIRSWLLSA